MIVTGTDKLQQGFATSALMAFWPVKSPSWGACRTLPASLHPLDASGTPSICINQKMSPHCRGSLLGTRSPQVENQGATREGETVTVVPRMKKHSSLGLLAG